MERMKGEKTQKQDEDLNKRPIMHKDKEGGALGRIGGWSFWGRGREGG